MENEKTVRRKARSNAGFDKEAPLEAASAGAAEAPNLPAGYAASKNISERRFLSSEHLDALSHYNTKEMVLRILRETSEEYFINLLENLKRDIREKDCEKAATNFANALFPSGTKG
ncbi:hypothetical protein [Novosphingobium taihuense]|uniref:Uncharacterized protein n=1 Tax=Novosphingobium taihuense TaxID=260085 RepID=A0A7W7AFN3_9SPHN|nr:hypothetical protein [Novosphingobium taihuense]MBB4615375.1 hypothetical protein [Novosphingobium taihuense]TWH82174.1 hypothetical protein IQ25_03326 [Novosphingobium taihuense]